MEYEIVKALESDFEDIIDFGNYVFKVDFVSLLPKLYKDKPENAKYHYVVKESHKIKAMVGCFPLQLYVGGNKLNVAGIGTVSVHPYARSKGYMKILITKAVEDSRNAEVDMIVLGGMRQRYEYFGFSVCGTQLNIAITSENARHHKEIEYTDIKFINLTENLEFKSKCQELHALLPISTRRSPEKFVEISQSFDCTPYAILNNEKFLGYVIASNDNRDIKELVLNDYKYSNNAVFKFLQDKNVNAINVHPVWYQIELIHKLNQVCESVSINQDHNYNILNYPNVIKCFMEFKDSLSPLMEGEFIIDVIGVERYLIKLCESKVSVTQTDLPYNITLSHLEAMTFLFSPINFITNLASKIDLAKNWFPIPLLLPNADNV